MSITHRIITVLILQRAFMCKKCKDKEAYNDMVSCSRDRTPKEIAKDLSIQETASDLKQKLEELSKIQNTLSYKQKKSIADSMEPVLDKLYPEEYSCEDIAATSLVLSIRE